MLYLPLNLSVIYLSFASNFVRLLCPPTTSTWIPRREAMFSSLNHQQLTASASWASAAHRNPSRTVVYEYASSASPLAPRHLLG